MDLIILSNNSPHHGALSRLKYHCKLMLLLYHLTSGWVKTEWTADLNVFPLSDTILSGNPLLAVKRLKHHMKASAVMFGARSRCTALVTLHVYRHIHTFFSVTNPWVLTNNGLAKSTLNAGSSCSRNCGNGGGCGAI